MSKLAAVRWPHSLWPQKVRTRLTLIYASLFLAGGSALLGLTYGLLAANLPSKAAAKPVLSRSQYFDLCKKAHPLPPKSRTNPKSTKPAPPPAKLTHLCERAYAEGKAAGSADQRRRALHDLLLYSIAGLGLMTFASAGAGWLVAGRVLRPVRTITETARRASEQHLGERIALTGARDELKELADTFDDMLARLDFAFGAQRRFVADASHELRTPLTLMRTAIDVTLAKPGRTAEQLESMAQRVRGSVDRAEKMIDSLLTLAVSEQAPISGGEPYDLATGAEDALDAATAEIGRLGLVVQADLLPARTIGSTHLLDRMIGNIVDNAVKHNQPGGEITVTSGTRGEQAFLHVVNTGAHVPADAVPSLFEPFRRLDGRAAGPGGVGLGLAIVRSVAIAHGATLQAESRPAGGLDLLLTTGPHRDPG